MCLLISLSLLTLCLSCLLIYPAPYHIYLVIPTPFPFLLQYAICTHLLSVD